MSLFRRSVSTVDHETALPGRAHRPYAVSPHHVTLKSPMFGPWPDGSEVLYVAMGCFWGVERIFYQMPGVISTAAGYMGGYTPNPTYEETCTGRTGHTETVQVVFDPRVVSAERLLATFWENHDSTTANRQGNDVGTQYRSAIFWTTPDQEKAVRRTKAAFASELARHGRGEISTDIRPAAAAGEFFYAEDYHQQYLAKNPGGYCNHGPNGLTCAV